MHQFQKLLDLAKDPSLEARESLTEKTVDEMLYQGREFTVQEIELFDLLFAQLYQYAKNEVKEKLTSALAFADWAPKSLIRELAKDNYEYAQPIIAMSPLVDDVTLIDIVRNQSLAHQISVAERPNIKESVTHALIETEQKIVLSTLTKNNTADIAPDDFEILVKIGKSDPKIIESLAYRRDLPPSLIATVYSLASSEARSEIAKKLPVDLIKRLETLSEIIIADNKVNSKPKQPATINFISLFRSRDKEKIIHGFCDIYNLNKEKLMDFMNKDPINSNSILVRSLELDRSWVQTLIQAFSPKPIIWKPEFDKKCAKIYIKYTPHTAQQFLIDTLR